MAKRYNLNPGEKRKETNEKLLDTKRYCNPHMKGVDLEGKKPVPGGDQHRKHYVG